MNPVNASAPAINPLITSSLAVTASAITTVTALSNVTGIVSSPPVDEAVGSSGSWITTIAHALSIESVLGVDVEALSVESLTGVSADTLLCVAAVTKDSVFAAMSLVSTVNAVRRCLNDGFVSVDGLVALTSGLNAVTTLDRLAMVGTGISIGIGHFGFLTGGLVNAATMVNRASQGDIPGALLSGTKLVATIALTGHPVALGIVVAADGIYGVYCMVAPYLATDSNASSANSFDPGYSGPLDQVVEQLIAQAPNN